MGFLSSIETSTYFCVWITSALYSMYSCQTASNIFTDDLSEDLVNGWKWLKRKRDTSDYEWNIFTPLLYQWLPYVAIYLLINQMIRCKFPQHVPILSILIGLIWIYNQLGPKLTVIIILQPLLLHTVANISSLTVVWATCLAASLSLHSFLIPFFSKYSLFPDNGVEYLFSVLLLWTFARSISYISDTASDVSKHSYPNLLYYCFYLPLLPTGPLVCYKDFQKSILSSEAKWGLTVRNILLIVRCVFWWMFHDLALHYSYHTALQYHPYLVEKLDIWAAGGLGYTLAQFFMIKYFVFYGLPSSLAQLDGINAPPPPKCISRIHLYSQMWRDFDRGLYNFMLSYIYIPIKGQSNSLWAKLKGSAATFFFVCIWHGGTSAVVIWCICNYLGICLEKLAGQIAVTHPLVRLKESISEDNWTRMTAIVASPLLLMSALSNFYFFTDFNVGTILARKAVLDGGIYRFSMIMLIMYCSCHVSMRVSAQEKNKKKQV